MERFVAKIRDMSLKGLGVADHPNGCVYFVPGAWVGDLVELEVTESGERYGFAKIVRTIEPSLDRTEIPCPYQGHEIGRCGGCPWMMAKYEAQLKIKEQHIRHHLQRVNILSECTQIHPIWGSPKAFGYRNRAQLKSDGKQVGFVSRQSRELVDIHDCLVLTDKNRETLRRLRQSLPNQTLKPIGDYQWAYVEIDDQFDFENIVPNRRLPFRQGNDEQNERMRSWLRDQVKDLDKSQTVIELFSGSGNFTEILSEAGFQRIVAVEVSKAATAALAQKAFARVEAHTMDLFNSRSWRALKKLAKEAQVLVLDPPREGFREVSYFLQYFKRIHTILFISCEGSSFARDAARLRKVGFELKEVQPLDQFPHTPYAEILARFGKVSDS